MVLIFFNDVREVMIFLDPKHYSLGGYKNNGITWVLTFRDFLRFILRSNR